MFLRNTRSLLFLAVTGVVAACGPGSDSGGEQASALLVRLTVADGVDIDEVAWKVTGGVEDMTGTIDTSAPGSTASIELFGIPEGSGYLVEMEALTAEGDFFCTGTGQFDVVAGVATPVDVTLNCFRECGVLVCADPPDDCRVFDLPDGTSCAEGRGSCVDGACEIPGF